jgi:hypothetical protein
MVRKKAIHLRAWTEDWRRMNQIDRSLNLAAEVSAKEACAAIDNPPSKEGSRNPPMQRLALASRRFPDPPQFVTTTDFIDGVDICPAPEHAADWRLRIADCFGVDPTAAFALLSRLRFHLSGPNAHSAHLLNNFLATVHAYSPRNMIEAELVVTMVIASHQADRQLMSAQGGGHLPTLLERTRLGQKFLGLHLQALDRFVRIRGLTGQQTIIVQHTAVTADTVVLPGPDR